MFRGFIIVVLAASAGYAQPADKTIGKKSKEAINQELALAQTMTEIEVTAPRKSAFEIGLLAGTAMSTLTNAEKSLTGGTRTTEVVFTGGLMANINMNQLVSVETGIFYTPKDIGIEGGVLGLPADTVSSMRALEVPLMARVWLADYFSLGVGGYYSIGVGKVDTTARSNGNSVNLGAQANQTYESAKTHAVDYGLIFGAQLKLPVTTVLNFIVDSRYNLGIRDMRLNPKGGDAERFRTLRFFMGATFNL